MAKVQVSLDERSYTIHIGRALLPHYTDYLPDTLSQQVLIVTNPLVGSHYLDTLRACLGDRSVHVFYMQDGEQYKSLDSYTQAMDQLINAGFNRDCAIIALGGGVVGDLAGFIAATFQRGVDFYQIPTTLLSQVDSSVGGKTAVNHPQGKNLIGAFYQPKSVVIDIDCLRTLSDRDYRSGLAEVVKYGIIYDAEFFAWLERNTEPLNHRDADALCYAIQRSCDIKAEVVAQDEREKGLRALLNLGHTFGHAIEGATEYGTWTHGEAVAAGTIIASKLAEVTQRLRSSDFRRIHALLSALGLPTQGPQMPWQDWLDYMQRDKKVKDGQLHFVLPTGIGQAEVISTIPAETVAAVVTECC